MFKIKHIKGRNIYFWLRFIFVYQTCLNPTFKIGFWVQNHLLNLCSRGVNSKKCKMFVFFWYTPSFRRKITFYQRIKILATDILYPFSLSKVCCLWENILGIVGENIIATIKIRNNFCYPSKMVIAPHLVIYIPT